MVLKIRFGLHSLQLVEKICGGASHFAVDAAALNHVEKLSQWQSTHSKLQSLTWA